MSVYIPPTLPLNISWAGTDPYTPSLLPLAATWEGSGGGPPAPTGTTIKVQQADGTWLAGLLKHYNGTAFEPIFLKHWNGTAWETL